MRLIFFIMTPFILIPGVVRLILFTSKRTICA